MQKIADETLELANKINADYALVDKYRAETQSKINRKREIEKKIKADNDKIKSSGLDSIVVSNSIIEFLKNIFVFLLFPKK